MEGLLSWCIPTDNNATICVSLMLAFVTQTKASGSRFTKESLISHCTYKRVGAKYMVACLNISDPNCNPVACTRLLEVAYIGI